MNAPATPKVIEFPVSDAAPLTSEAAITVADAKRLQVTDSTSYALAGTLVTGLKSLSKRITAFFEDDVRRAHELHRSLTKKRSDAVTPIDMECARLTREMGTWKAEQDRLAREEAARLSREQQALEQRVQLEVAAALEAQGLSAEAESVVEQAISMPAPVVPVAPSTPKVEGISYRETWKHQIVDAALIPREWLIPDEQAIAAFVRSTKGAKQIPGIRIYPEQTAIVRGA